MIDASLSGRVEAVGILELLRLPLNTNRTGTLIVVSADADAADAEARFHYVEGKLVGASLGTRSGSDALRGILSWSEGEFEFSSVSEAPSALDEKLHGILVQELKAWYSKRVAKNAVAAGEQSPPESSVTATTEAAQAVAAAGRGAKFAPAPALTPPRPQQQSTVKNLAAYRDNQRSGGAPAAAEPLRPNVLGAGKVDAKGAVSEPVGQFSVKEGAVCFAVQQVAAAIGKELGFGAVRSIEVKGKGERWAAMETRDGSITAIVCKPDTDLSDELAHRH